MGPASLRLILGNSVPTSPTGLGSLTSPASLPGRSPFLVVVLDAFSRRFVGWTMSRDLCESPDWRATHVREHLRHPRMRVARSADVAHQVEVTATADGKLLYSGKTYRSLSAIAREITGTRWSGPAFFGLKHEKGSGDASQTR